MKTITILLFLFLFTFAITNAQVGIGTTNPKALLDIAVGDPANPALNNGILIPRLDKLPSTNPGADQHGMLMYLTTDVSGYFKGFHYWDNNVSDWIPLRNEWTRAVNGAGEAYIRSNIAFENGFQLNFGENGDFGIGTNDPIEHIELRREGDNDMQFTSASTNPPNLIFYNTGGTLDAPTALAANQEIGSMIFKTHDGSGVQEVGGLRMYMDGTPTTGSTPAKFVFNTTPEGSTSQVAVMTLNNQGNVVIGGDTPESTLDVRATNHLGAVSESDGILVPRVNALTVNGLNDGQLVYLIADAGSYKKGFHYWDNVTGAWMPINTNIEPWNKAETTNPATSNTDNIYTMGQVGIGTNNPRGALQITTENSRDVLFLRFKNELDDDLDIDLFRSLGTVASPGLLPNDTRIGGLRGQSFTGTAPFGFNPSAEIYFQADGATTSTSSAGKIKFATTPNGTTSTVDRMVIREDGDVGIATSDPQAKLHVNGSLRISNGSQGAGKVLTSDANGTATWQTPPSSQAMLRNDVAYIFSGSTVVFNFSNSLFNSITGSSFSGTSLTLPQGVYEIESELALNTNSSVEWNLRVGGTVSTQSVKGVSASASYNANISSHKQIAIVNIPSGGSMIDFIVLSYSGSSISVDPSQCYMKIRRIQ